MSAVEATVEGREWPCFDRWCRYGGIDLRFQISDLRAKRQI